MVFNRRSFLLALAALAMSVPGWAQSAYPQRPIKLIVPYPPAGTTDIVARIAATKMSSILGQPIVVENRAGTGGSIGSAAAAKAPADGYTLVMLVESSHAVNPNVSRKLPYDAIKDFAPISNLADVPNVLVVGSKFKSLDFAGMVAALKANPGKYAYGSSGPGGLSNGNGELFKHVTGTSALHVPYKGMAPVLSDVMSGQVDFCFDSISSSIGFIEGGQLKPLAVAAPDRLKKLPQVPTFAELGMPALNHPSWFGIGAPAGMPADILDTLNKAVVQALADKDVIAQFDRLGAIPAPMTRQAFAEFIKSENARWKKLVEETGIERQ